MNNFIRVGAVSPLVKIGDIDTNVFHITNSYYSNPDLKYCDVVVYPELCLTGYTCADLFTNHNFMKGDVWDGLEKIKSWAVKNSVDSVLIVGAPIEYNGSIYNCAVVMRKDTIFGIVPKSYLPNYNEFYEARWFRSGVDIIGQSRYHIPFGTDLIFDTGEFKFGIEICEDLWSPIPPSSKLALAGAEVIFNLSASNELVGKDEYLRSLISNQSARCICGYVYTSAGHGESSTDVVYIPKEYIYENGSYVKTGYNFAKTNDYKSIDGWIDLNRIRLHRAQNTTYRSQSIVSGYRTIYTRSSASRGKFNRTYSSNVFNQSDLNTIFNIQVEGLMRRLESTNGNVVIGVSGGSDSTLALLVCYEAFRRMNDKNKVIYGVTMPGFGTTDWTKSNAITLMDLLEYVEPVIIPINASVTQHMSDIQLDPKDRSVTYENCQARERTQILMDYANKVGAIVVGTGDLSELALGWCTYNADHMSMYNVNVSIPKTLVLDLISWYRNNYTTDKEVKDVLKDILDTKISPELLPDQDTEDTIGSYKLHDFFLYHMMRSGWDGETLLEIAKMTFRSKFTASEITKTYQTFISRFKSQQFKRSCLPDGPKVGSVSLSPRGDWRMPSDMR